MKKLSLFYLLLFAINLTAQWSTFTNSVPTLSSPRSADLNGDDVLDVVIGAGTDSTYSANGVLAFDGATGSSLWVTPSYDEVFSSAVFNDINNDNVPDVFIGGRNSQFFALNGVDGTVIWEAFPQGTGLIPSDSGWYNFYSGQVIPDQNADAIDDILVANGGDHNANPWDPRPPGHLMILSGATGSVLAKAVMPDSNETYCSPVIADLQNNGTLQVVFGTGGENHGGAMWVANFSDLVNNDLSNSIMLSSNSSKGFIAPASLADFNGNGYLDIIIQSYSGEIMRFDGLTLTQQWSVVVANSESSAAPVIGNFIGGDLTPDVFAVCNKGVAPSFFDHYQVMINGETGQVEWKDSISDLHFASANAFDSNQDGRDEVLISVNQINGYFQHELLLIDFQNNNISNLTSLTAGVNLASTPLVTDLDNDNLIDIVYAYRADSTNPSAWNGIYVNRLTTNIDVPFSGIAWGGYMGNQYDGLYASELTNCGPSSVVSSFTVNNPSCNGLSDGIAALNPISSNSQHSYLWSDGSVNDSLLSVNAGAYKVIVIDSLGCYEMVSFSLSDPYIISFGNVINNICPGDATGTATLSSSGCPCMFSGCTFDWENGDSTKTANGLAAGTWSVAITHLDGCVVVDSVEIVDGPAVIDSSAVTHLNCFNVADGAIELIPSDTTFTTYIWNTGETDSGISNLSAGNYSVEVDNPNCYDTLYFTVEAADSIYISNALQDLNCFNDSSGELTISSFGGAGIEFYSFNNNLYALNQFSNLSSGTYLTYTLDSLGCYSDSIFSVINQPDSIELNFSSSPESNNGSLDGSASVVALGGTSPYSYLWSNSFTDSMIVDLASGWYNLVLTDYNGCESTDSVFVESLLSACSTNLCKDNWNIFPNPALDYFTIDSDISMNYTLSIYNSLGGLVAAYKADKFNKEYNVQHLSSGLYHLVIQSDFQLFTTPLIIKR